MVEKEELYNLLKEIFLLLDIGDRQLFGCYDLTVPRYYTLYHLFETPGLSLSQLSEKLFCDKSNITRIFRGLEEKELVSRHNHESDGRIVRCFITDKGTAVFHKVTNAHKNLNQSRFNHFDNHLQIQLQQVLFQLRQNLSVTDTIN